MRTAPSTEGWFTVWPSQRGAVVEGCEKSSCSGRRLPSQLICIHSMAVMIHTTNEASNRTGELSITPALFISPRRRTCSPLLARECGCSPAHALAACVWCSKVRSSYLTLLACHTAASARQSDRTWWRHVGAKCSFCSDRLWLWVPLSSQLLWCRCFNENTLLIAIRGRKQMCCGKTNHWNI